MRKYHFAIETVRKAILEKGQKPYECVVHRDYNRSNYTNRMNCVLLKFLNGVIFYILCKCGCWKKTSGVYDAAVALVELVAVVVMAVAASAAVVLATTAFSNLYVTNLWQFSLM